MLPSIGVNTANSSMSPVSETGVNQMDLHTLLGVFDVKRGTPDRLRRPDGQQEKSLVEITKWMDRDQAAFGSLPRSVRRRLNQVAQNASNPQHRERRGIA